MIVTSLTHEAIVRLLPFCAACNSALLAWLVLSTFVAYGEEDQPAVIPARRNYWITYRKRED